jgi:hypothetical protein
METILDVDYRLCITWIIHQQQSWRDITSADTRTRTVEYKCFGPSSVSDSAVKETVSKDFVWIPELWAVSVYGRLALGTCVGPKAVSLPSVITFCSCSCIPRPVKSFYFRYSLNSFVVPHWPLRCITFALSLATDAIQFTRPERYALCAQKMSGKGGSSSVPKHCSYLGNNTSDCWRARKYIICARLINVILQILQSHAPCNGNWRVRFHPCTKQMNCVENWNARMA